MPAPERSVTLDDGLVRDTVRLVDKSGVVTSLEEWAKADASGLGGRPETFPKRTLVVAMFLGARLGWPMQAKVWHEILCYALSPSMKRELQIESLDPGKAGYRNVRTRFYSIVHAIDYSPRPKNRCLPPEEFEHSVSKHSSILTDERVAELQGRQEWLINQVIRIGVDAMPRELLDRWQGGIAVDATPIATFARGPKMARQVGHDDRQIIEHSSDADAGWYVREGDHADTGASGQSKYVYGYEHTLAFMAPTTRTESGLYPNLVLGMARPHIPGQSPGVNGLSAIRHAQFAAEAAGRRAKLVCGDNAYVNARPEDFAVRVRALGLDLVVDYNTKQAGRQGQHDGALLVDGAWYCPAMPEALIEATNDHRNGAIDEPSYQRRLQDRRAYALRPKARAEANGSIRMMCPAAGVATTMRCDHKPGSRTPRHRGKRSVDLNHLLRNDPPKVCRQQSITIPAIARGRFEQPLIYGTEEWRSAYQTMRSANEGGNGTIKDPGYQDIQSAGRRRIRGQAANALITCLQYAAHNLRAVLTYAAKAEADATGEPRITRLPRTKRQARTQTAAGQTGADQTSPPGQPPDVARSR